MLADEPTGNLDSVTGALLLGLIHELHRNGTTIVVITHDRDIAAHLPRQVEIIDGRIVADSGPPPAAGTSAIKPNGAIPATSRGRT